jgi:hypothetical protein
MRIVAVAIFVAVLNGCAAPRLGTMLKLEWQMRWPEGSPPVWPYGTYITSTHMEGGGHNIDWAKSDNGYRVFSWPYLVPASKHRYMMLTFGSPRDGIAWITVLQLPVAPTDCTHWTKWERPLPVRDGDNLSLRLLQGVPVPDAIAGLTSPVEVRYRIQSGSRPVCDA